MPVPATIEDLSPVASENSPAGSAPVGPDLDNHLRAHAAIIRKLYDDLAGSDGAKMIGYKHSIADAVERVLQYKLDDILTFYDLGGVGDGVTPDDLAFQRAAATNKIVLFPNPPVAWVIDAPVNITGSINWFGSKRGNVVRKTSLTTNPTTRQYVDNLGVTQTSTWNEPCCFQLVHPTNSYLVDVVMSGFTFDLADDATVGAFDAKRIAHSSFDQMFCDISKFFFKGIDNWMCNHKSIRSRFSKDHYNITGGTSNKFSTVHCDQKYSTGGTGFTLTNMEYTVLEGCGTDFVDTCYRIIGGSVSLNGCGAESFSRILYASGGALVDVNGGSLAVYKAASAAGNYEPYRADGAGTRVSFNGAVYLGIKNTASPGGTYDKLAVTNGAIVSYDNCRRPSELGSPEYFISGSGSSLTIKDENGNLIVNANGVSRINSSIDIKYFTTTKSISAGSSQSVFRMNVSDYGCSAFGKINVWLFNTYSGDAGFVGHQLYSFAVLRETSTVQNITKIGDATAMFNTGGPALGTITATLLRNGDNTVDFQLNIPAAFGSTTVIAEVEYQARVGGAVTSDRVVAI